MQDLQVSQDVFEIVLTDMYERMTTMKCVLANIFENTCCSADRISRDGGSCQQVHSIIYRRVVHNALYGTLQKIINKK